MTTPATEFNLDRGLPSLDYAIVTPDRREHDVTEWVDGVVLTEGHVIYPRVLGSGPIAALVCLTFEYVDD